MSRLTLEQARFQAYEECAKIAESYVRFANHNPHCREIAEEIRKTAAQEKTNRKVLGIQERQFENP